MVTAQNGGAEAAGAAGRPHRGPLTAPGGRVPPAGHARPPQASRRAAAGQYRLRGALAAAHSHAARRRDAAGALLSRPLRLEAGAAPGGRR